MNLARGLLFIAVGMLFGADVAWAQSVPDAKVSVEQILDAWKARQGRVQSLRIKFTESRTMHRKKNRILTREHEVVLDGLRYRHERNGENWALTTDEAAAQRYVAIFDGEHEVYLLGYEARTDRLHPLGTVRPAAKMVAGSDSEAHNQEVWPIFHAFRSRQPGFIPSDVLGWRLTGQFGTIAGHKCPIIEKIDVTTERYRVWVDPQRDFCALRLEMGPKSLEVAYAQLDIEYQHDASGVWIPTQWTNLVHCHSEGRLVLQWTARFAATEYELNPAVDNDAFRVDFPPGTEVLDSSGGTRTLYLVRESGKRPILDEERLRGARYSDFAATESGRALLPPGSGAFSWRWLLAAVVVAGASALALRRR